MQFTTVAVSLLTVASFALAQASGPVSSNSKLAQLAYNDFGDDDVQDFFSTLCHSACDQASMTSGDLLEWCLWCEFTVYPTSSESAASPTMTMTFTETQTMVTLSSRAAQFMPLPSTTTTIYTSPTDLPTITLGSSTIMVPSTSSFAIVASPTTVTVTFMPPTETIEIVHQVPVPTTEVVYDYRTQTETTTAEDFDLGFTTVAYNVPIAISTSIPGTFTLELVRSGPTVVSGASSTVKAASSLALVGIFWALTMA